MAKKPRESLVMSAKKKKKKKPTKKKPTKKKPKKPTTKKPTKKPKPLIFGTELPVDTLPAREDERPEYSP